MAITIDQIRDHVNGMSSDDITPWARVNLLQLLFDSSSLPHIDALPLTTHSKPKSKSTTSKVNKRNGPTHQRPRLADIANDEENAWKFGPADTKAFDHFCITTFAEIQQLKTRDILKAWIKELEPNRRKLYPYSCKNGSHPQWWPPTIPYRELDHISKRESCTLALTILHWMMQQELNPRGTQGIDRLEESTKCISLRNEWDTQAKVERRKHLLAQLYWVARMCLDCERGNIDADDVISVSELQPRLTPFTTKARSREKKQLFKVLNVFELHSQHLDEHLQETYEDGNCKMEMQPTPIATAVNPDINSTGQSFKDLDPSPPKHVPFVQQPDPIPITSSDQPPVPYFDGRCQMGTSNLQFVQHHASVPMAPPHDTLTSGQYSPDTQCHGVSETAVFTATAGQSSQLPHDLCLGLSHQGNAAVLRGNDSFAPQHVSQSGKSPDLSIDMRCHSAQTVNTTPNHGAPTLIQESFPLVYSNQHPTMLVASYHEPQFDAHAAPINSQGLCGTVYGAERQTTLLE